MKSWEKINTWLAVKITKAVGTMECAYIFALLAVWGGFGVDWHNSLQIVQWVSQTFLQLVLLSIIMVGQGLLGSASEKRAQEDHEKIIVQFEEIKQIHNLNKQSIEEIKEMHKDLHQLISVIKSYVEVIHAEQPKSRRKNFSPSGAENSNQD